MTLLPTESVLDFQKRVDERSVSVKERFDAGMVDFVSNVTLVFSGSGAMSNAVSALRGAASWSPGDEFLLEGLEQTYSYVMSIFGDAYGGKSKGKWYRVSVEDELATARRTRLEETPIGKRLAKVSSDNARFRDLYEKENGESVTTTNYDVPPACYWKWSFGEAEPVREVLTRSRDIEAAISRSADMGDSSPWNW